MTAAREVIQRLDLRPHSEGGWNRETWRSEPGEDRRATATAILFLLEGGERSHWHKVDATELWLFHAGSSLRIETAVSDKGPIRSIRLGDDVLSGEEPQFRIAPDQWQAAVADRGWSLVSCVVSPGFQFEGFTLAPAGWSPC